MTCDLTNLIMIASVLAQRQALWRAARLTKIGERAITVLVVAFFVPKSRKDGIHLHKEEVAKPPLKQGIIGRIPAWTGRLYIVYIMTICMYQTAYADIFDTAKSAMQKVYTDIAGLATVAAVVCAAVCLFLMNFSRSGKTVDESRAWLKRIVICWAALMTLGAIVSYMESVIPKSMFTG